MKVVINIQIASNSECTKLNLVVGDGDTVESVKDRVAVAEFITFPDLDLLLNGEVLVDGKKLIDCGVKDKCSLDLVVKASETKLVQQLTELLQFQKLSCKELGMMYCYKHGANITQVLKTIGQTGKLQDFVKKQKCFHVENNTVALRDEPSPKPITSVVAAEVEQILKANGSVTMEIKDVCSKFSQKFHVSLSQIVAMKPDDFLAKEKDLFVTTGRGQVSLKSSLPTPAKPVRKASLPKPALSLEPAPQVENFVQMPPRLDTRFNDVMDFYGDEGDEDEDFYGPSETKPLCSKTDEPRFKEDCWTSEGDDLLVTTGSSSEGSDSEFESKPLELVKKPFHCRPGRSAADPSTRLSCTH
jgi:hypothetical protein